MEPTSEVIVCDLLLSGTLVSYGVALGQIFPDPIGEFKTIRVGGRTDTTCLNKNLL